MSDRVYHFERWHELYPESGSNPDRRTIGQHPRDERKLSDRLHARSNEHLLPADNVTRSPVFRADRIDPCPLRRLSERLYR